VRVENVAVYLIGPPGVGKYSVGTILAAAMPARLIDNHYWNNPILEILEPDGVTPLPPAVWDQTAAVRTAVFETIATLAPPARSFVFTHAISHDGGHEADHEIAAQILSTARRRGARTLVARLSCAEPELRERIETPARAVRLKGRDGSKAALYNTFAAFVPRHDWIIDIDTTALSPEQTAARIMGELETR
jgi:hypothetical protein